MIYERTTSEATQIKGEFESELTRLKNYLQCIEQEVTPFNSSIRETASQGIKVRREKILRDRDLVEKIGFPLRRRKRYARYLYCAASETGNYSKTSACIHYPLQTRTRTGYARVRTYPISRFKHGHGYGTQSKGFQRYERGGPAATLPRTAQWSL